MSIAIKAAHKRNGFINPYKGRKRPKEIGDRIRQTKQGKCAGVNKGIVRNNLRKPVVADNVDGTLYMRFDCMRDALLHFEKKPDSTSHLKRALDNSNKIVYNKRWRYENQNNG